MCEQRAGSEYSRVQTSCADECLLLPASSLTALALRQESKCASGQFPVCWIPIQCVSEHSRAASPAVLTGVSVGLSSGCGGKPGLGVSIGGSGSSGQWPVSSMEE